LDATPNSASGGKMINNNKESIDFQKECFKEILKEYNYSCEGFTNDFLLFFILFLENIVNLPHGQEMLHMIIDKIEDHVGGISYVMIEIICKYKVKVCELENLRPNLGKG
jgi:hypothetical protein